MRRKRSSSARERSNGKRPGSERSGKRRYAAARALRARPPPPPPALQHFQLGPQRGRGRGCGIASRRVCCRRAEPSGRPRPPVRAAFPSGARGRRPCPR